MYLSLTFHDHQQATPFASITSSSSSAMPAAGSSSSDQSRPDHHNELQLWIREQLAKVPFFQPIIQKMTQAELAASASGLSLTSGEAGIGGSRSAPGSRRAGGSQSKLPNMKPEDRPLWDMFVVSSSDLFYAFHGGHVWGEIKLSVLCTSWMDVFVVS
jgi:hypothetical protein